MKLYVGNLAYSTTEEDLQELFSKFKSFKSAQIIIDRATNRSKGFGFVELDSDADGHDAIEELNESDFGGRSIIVNEARPQEKKEGGHGGGGRGNGNGDRRPFNKDNKRGPRY